MRVTLVLAFLGALVGIALWSADGAGYFIRWQELPQAPQPVTRLVASREFTLYVQGADGESFKWNGKTWTQGAAPDDLGRGWAIIKPCRRAWPEFSPLSNSPGPIIDCIQDEGVYAEFFNKHVYVLSADGNIFEWELLTHGLAQLLTLLIWPGIGCFAGIVLGLMWFWIVHTREPNNAIRSMRAG